MNPIRVVLVDDHYIVRQGLRSILDPDPRFEVVGEAGNGVNALRVVTERQPDAVLLDLKLPDMGGVDLCQRIIRACPETAVLILTAFIDHDLVDACLRAGAQGYLLKDAENLHLCEHLIAVVKGHAALDPRAANVLTDYLRQHAPSPDLLSPRELQVLRLIAQGLTNKEIGATLYISENTVKGHVREILAKMNARNRIEAVLLAKERRLV